MRKLFRTKLEAAIAQLKADKRIESEKDVLRDLDYKSKGTLSAYKTGATEISPEFQNKFEKFYGVKLEDYADLITGTPEGFIISPHHGSRAAEAIDYRDEYITLLKKNLAEEEEIKKALLQELTAIKENQDKILQRIDTLENNTSASLTAYMEFARRRMVQLRAIQKYLVEQHAKLKKVPQDQEWKHFHSILLEEHRTEFAEDNP